MLAPTLIVGLGGKGSDVAARVANMVTKEQRKRIGFVVFDTDVNELRSIAAANPFIRTVQTSTKLSVGEYLNIDTHARDNWFPVNKILSRKTLTEGAGQVRAISRLALDTAIRAGNMEPLHKAIEDLYKLEGDSANQALRVIIVSSLAGGTGSGLILPVAMYIRNFLQTRFQQNANITRGFFILPEVFYEVIKGQAERNNLKCNAYATLRELDAFLMKGDGTLPEKYASTLKLEFPRVASKELEDYDVMPYDFCFLFDAQNVDGKKLNSFNQYLTHAANCIYAQSIGPMNKRSNSSEDNTIRELCKSGGRNRYAGAGSSMLLYPYYDVQEYVALQWASQCISDQWLYFDRQFRAKSIQRKEMRAKGLFVRDIHPGQDYIMSVDEAANTKNPFGVAIRNVCSVFDDSGLTRTGFRWIEYVENLKAYVRSVSDSGQTDLDRQRQTVRNKMGEIGDGANSMDLFYDAYIELAKYKNMVLKRVEDAARATAYSLFKAENTAITKERLKHQLETYLRDDTGSFIHPNAVRYFLYQTLETLTAEKEVADRENAKNLKYFDGFERATFDDPATEEREETVEDLRNKKVSLIHRITKKLSGEQQDLLDAYNLYLKTINEYRVRAVYAEVLGEGIDYVRNLCEAFQVFYNSFEGNVATICTKLEKLGNKYEGLKGHATRYVCVSKKCFEKFEARMPYNGSAMTLPSELCDGVYSQVRKYAMLKDKPNETYFQELFEEGVIGYFRTSVMASYGADIKMDIIRALETEAQYEHEEFDNSRIEQFVKRTILETKSLSEPFIEKPLGEQKATIPACAFNPSIRQTGNPAREQLVDAELMNDGGCPDDDIGENMILFYKAIYGLRANELSKFAPPSKSETAARVAGEYHKAYFELISQIKPKSQETPIITPHIDKDWHLISKLPHLDEGDQIEHEKEIYKAFMLGLIFDKIRYKVIANNKKWYRLFVAGSSFEDFVVSNGTSCDAYYEVLDALTINPIVVKAIIQSVERDIEKQRYSNEITFEVSKLKTSLDNFLLPEFSAERRMSIFDIATLLKVSTPADAFRDEQGVDLAKVMLDVLYDYTARLCPANEYCNIYGDFIMKQFEVYKHNISWYEDKWPSTLGSYIDSIINITVEKLAEKGLDSCAEAINAYSKGLDALKLKASAGGLSNSAGQ